LTPEDFGKTAQTHQDCLDGLGQTTTEAGEFVNSKAVFALWITEVIRGTLTKAREVGKEAREAQEEADRNVELEGHIKGLASHYGLSFEAVEQIMEKAEAEAGKKD